MHSDQVVSLTNLSCADLGCSLLIINGGRSFVCPTQGKVAVCFYFACHDLENPSSMANVLNLCTHLYKSSLENNTFSCVIGC